MPDFSEVRSVVMCGDPNSGKSVYSTIFREALKTLGVKVAHLDLDKAAPTPQWYLEAEVASGNIGGGRIKKDKSGTIIKITRLTAENARILEGTDAVLIVFNNPQGAAE